MPAINVFRIGQWVEIADGPFAALRGEIQKICTLTLDGIDAAGRSPCSSSCSGGLRRYTSMPPSSVRQIANAKYRPVSHDCDFPSFFALLSEMEKARGARGTGSNQHQKVTRSDDLTASPVRDMGHLQTAVIRLANASWPTSLSHCLRP
jgi:hypothetical protein